MGLEDVLNRFRDLQVEKREGRSCELEVLQIDFNGLHESQSSSHPQADRIEKVESCAGEHVLRRRMADHVTDLRCASGIGSFGEPV